MHSKHICTAVIILSIIFQTGLSITQQAESYNLRLNLNAGDSFTQKVTTTQEVLQTVLGMEQEINQNVELDFHYFVESVDYNRAARVRVTFKDLYITISGLTETMEYNSRNRSQNIPPFLRGFSTLVGKSFTMSLTSTARVIQASGLRDIFAEAASQSGQGGDLFQQTLYSGIASQFNDETIALMMENMFAIYPDRPVRKGESWSKYTEIEKGIRSIEKSTFTLKKTDRNFYEIDLKGNIEPVAKNERRASGLGELNFNLTGTKQGTLKIRISDGWVAEGKVTQKLNGSIDIAGLGAENLSIPISIIQTTTYSSPGRE
ncbi:DUF6263 family protein [candidate division KSB1 bacterium]